MDSQRNGAEIRIGIKAIAQSLHSVYRAENADAGLMALDAFEEGHWGRKYPVIALSWRRHWEQVITFFAFSEPIRRIIYTTNAIEALISKLRRPHPQSLPG